jgi:hypothetical protein
VTLAFVFGVGAALAAFGALSGTLLPQVQAAFLSLNPGHYEALATQEGGLAIIFVTNAALVTLGTVCTLLAFSYTTGHSGQAVRLGRRLVDAVVRMATGFGKVFVMFTVGALLATTSISFLAALVDRIRFLVETLWSWVTP